MFDKTIIAFLIILIAGLTVSTSYFYTQSQGKPTAKNTAIDTSKPLDNLDPKIEGAETEDIYIKQSEEKTSTENNADLNKKELNSQASNDGEQAPLVGKNRASNPEKSHEVKTGETLYPIGLQYNLDWNIIARANGMDNPNDIKTGNIIVIPEYDTDTNKITINYKIDPEKAASLEKNLSLGKERWRQDPIEVAKKESSPCFNIAASDSFSLGSKNEEKGIAQVSVIKNNKGYEIGLIQPITKDVEGFWTITYIKEI